MTEVAARGKPLDPRKREFREMHGYESGENTEVARRSAPDAEDPWQVVLETHEPWSPPALRWLLGHPRLGALVKGEVIDIAAGTCWASALVSQHPNVDRVWAFDMSEHFLTTVGKRMFERWNGDLSRLSFAVGDFNELPFDDGKFDAALMVACLHHSVTPMITLTEVLRTLKPGGRLFIIEHPAATMRVRAARRESLELSAGSATEVCYTAGEFDYLLRRACLPLNGRQGRLRRHRFDVHTRGWKALARKALRATGLEDIVRPGMSIFEIEVATL